MMITAWIISALVINWLGCWLLCNLYCLWLHRVSRDVVFEGWIWWRGVFPIARYRLASERSWFARAWDKWYGHGMLGCIIHKDKVGDFDDALVEEVIVHEIRHVAQQLVFGLVFYIIYAFDLALHGYHRVWFERDARTAVVRWARMGRPRIFNFGKRR